MFIGNHWGRVASAWTCRSNLHHGFTQTLCASSMVKTKQVRTHTVQCPLTRSVTTVLITDSHLYIPYDDSLLLKTFTFSACSDCSLFLFPFRKKITTILSHLSYCKPYKMSIVLTPYWSPGEGIQKLKMEARGALVYPIDTHISLKFYCL
jgi:hypothetical protein